MAILVLCTIELLALLPPARYLSPATTALLGARPQYQPPGALVPSRPAAPSAHLRLLYPMAPYGPSNQSFGLQESASMAVLLNRTLILPITM